LIIASNESWVVPVGGHERRFFVVDVSRDRMQDLPYIAAIKRQFHEEGGREALLHHLLSMDLMDFEVRRAPRTTALIQQQILSLSSEEEWWFGKLCDGQMLDGYHWMTPIEVNRVTNDYLTYTQRVGSRRAHKTSLGRFMRKMAPGIRRKQGIVQEADYESEFGKILRPYFWHMPSLRACRDQWDRLHGKADWPEVDESEDPNVTPAY